MLAFVAMSVLIVSYLYIYGLCSDAVSSLKCIASNGGMVNQ
jgi:hypothetical protein